MSTTDRLAAVESKELDLDDIATMHSVPYSRMPTDGNNQMSRWARILNPRPFIKLTNNNFNNSRQQ